MRLVRQFGSRAFVCASYSRVDETLDNGHAALGELLLGVTASSVGWLSAMRSWKPSSALLLTNVNGMVDVDVVGKGDVLDLNAAC